MTENNYSIFLGVSGKKDFGEEEYLCNSVESFIATLKINGIPRKVVCDHDLCDEHRDPSCMQGCALYNDMYMNFETPTGLHAISYLLEKCLETGNSFPEINVISENPCGKDNILRIIDFYKVF